MKTLKQLCKPRKSVFDKERRDVVLDLTDLIEEKIKPAEFFGENWVTGGMRHLLREAFRRFAGRSASGVIKLTQSMGGGKTHSMIALGLLAKHPELRKPVMGDDYGEKDLGPVRVVAFTGRESDAPLGIWGAIAEQLGKKEAFKDYYSPLSAPGQTAWIRLLEGEPLLILLDELPPYFEAAKAKTIGNSDLAAVTTTALANLLVAIGKDALSNVTVVISDLKATYSGGSQHISTAMKHLEDEVGRVAVNLEPVALNTEELYHILRTRLFDKLPEADAIWEVAMGYADSVRMARQMDLTNLSPEKFAQQIKESYPFHPAIRDLYARFRENPGFQQTRGLIRLMRIVVSSLYDGKPCKADALHLIHAHDLDLNERETLAEVSTINPTVENAISHDIASHGSAVAESMDDQTKSTDMRDAATLLLVSSLSNVPDAVVGLTISEIIGYLVAPGRDVSKLKERLQEFTTRAWYLHSTRDNKLYFKNVQNLVAKLKSLADGYNRESSLKELQRYLEKIFTPSLKDCYQAIQALPPVDEIAVKPDRVTLVISEPFGNGLHPDLQKFYDDLDFKNRVCFLSGQRDTTESLLESASELKAITFILEEMEKERLSDNDPQKVAAGDLAVKIQLRLLSTLRETFTRITYPTKDQLMGVDFIMAYKDNKYNGEDQIREALKAKQKFTEDVGSDIFRQKCEARLFTQKAMPWTEVKKRAATNPGWQWHRPDALDAMKDAMVHKDQWREQMGYVEKGPFAEPEATVQIQEINRNDDTGEVALRILPIQGDTVHYEIGQEATTASARIKDFKNFQTKDLNISFLCVDSQQKSKSAPPVKWQNRITIKSRTYQQGQDRMAELQAAPPVPIRYTTDGSDPRQNGGSYNSPFVIPNGTVCVLAVAMKDGVGSDVHRLDINWDETAGVVVDPNKPAAWKRRFSPSTTKDSYEILDLLGKFDATVMGPRIMVAGDTWGESFFDSKVGLNHREMLEGVEHLRNLLKQGQVSLEIASMRFKRGQDLLDWVAYTHTELKEGEVEQ
ncbi:MAG: DUF499 domain-containing protein [Acidobacteria bacterium]|nr:DUF499 domain-containing protein [Acidobacteriota bacterium]